MTRYARALGSKGANAKVPETPTPWSDMGVGKVERPDDIEEKNDPPKETRVAKPKKKVVKLAAPAANVQKPVKSTKSNIPAPLEMKIEKSVTQVLEKTEIEKPPTDTTPGTESGKTSKKRNKINTKDGVSSGKKMKVTLNQDQTDGAEAQNKKSEGKETEKSDNNSTGTKGKKGEKKKKLKKKTSVKNVNPADSLAENSTEDFQAKGNGSTLGNMKKNVMNQANENVVKTKGNQRKSFEKPVRKIVTNARDFQKPVAHLYDSEKEGLNKLALKKMNEERFQKVRQDLINSGASQDEVERKMYRIRRSIWKKLYLTICRRCRKRGHVLKDCPETATNSKNTKCYKCGETDHTSKMCLIKQEVYTFADCFICHQTGHLTKTCPNNTRGIYPRGGCCHYCSEVTHLARDCPKKYNKKETDNQEDEDLSKIKPVAVTLDVNQSGDADVSEHQAPKPIKSKGKRVVKF